jgi:pyruvate/2-oxoglutarate dehydrogenase complex dihydrolipoamide acyltransferase (E2) component
MEYKVAMPRLGEEMTRGKVIEWLKKEGDQVNDKETLFVVDTEKAALEVEAGATGVLRKILVTDPEKEIPVGETIAIIETKN